MSDREYLKLFNGSAESADFRGDVYTEHGRMYWASCDLLVESLDDDFTVHVRCAEVMRDFARENNQLEFVELVDKALAGDGRAADRVNHAIWRARYSSPLRAILLTNTSKDSV